MTTVVIHIEELVLHGFDAADRHAIGDAVQAEIERRFSAEALPPAWRQGAAIDRVAAGDVRLPASARGAGRTIGGAVHRSLSTGARR
jgi:hypothetical protein